MPTFNQLVKQGRTDKTYKSKAPVLQQGFNTLKNASHRSELSPEARRMHKGYNNEPEEA